MGNNNQPSTKKKIGLLSTVLLVIGSSIGAGIFLKNYTILDYNNQSISMSLISWVIGLVGIFALALTLKEIVSGCSKTNSQGMVGWNRTYNGNFVYQSSKNFMAYLHLPIWYLILPYYAIKMVQDAFGFQLDWWYAMLISLAFLTYFLFVSGLSTRVANIQNWVVTSIKFVPIAFAALVGLILIWSGTIQMNDNWWGPTDTHPGPDYQLFSQMFSLGILASLPAVFFAFDGFYTTAGIQSQMKEPKKSSMAMGLGIAIVGFIDIVISISLLLASQDGTIAGLSWFKDAGLWWVIQTIQVLIAFGMIGIMNALSIYTVRYYEDLVRTDEIPFGKKFKDKLNDNRPIVGVIYAYILFSAFIIFGGIIGGTVFLDTGSYGDQYGTGMNTLYSFLDNVGEWNAVFGFGFIVLAVVGCLRNRKTKKIKTEKTKAFIPASLVTIIIVGVGLSYVFVESIGNIIVISDYYTNGYVVNGITMYVDTLTLISSYMVLIVLALFCGIMFIPSLVRIFYFDKKHYKNLVVSRDKKTND